MSESINTATCRSVLHGLFYREWLQHGWWLTAALVAWFLCVWVLLLFPTALCILFYGAAFAYIAGPALGGADAREGCEEFAFALPPLRKERFLLRFVLGLIPLLIMTWVGAAAVGLDLPQKLWGLVVESGFTEPFPQSAQTGWYLATICVPLWIYCFGFSFAAAASSRSYAGRFAQLLTVVVVGPILWGCVAFTDAGISGVVAAVMGSCLSLAAVAASLWKYKRKDAVNNPMPTNVGLPGWITAVIAVAALLMALLFLARVQRPVQVESAPASSGNAPTAPAAPKPPPSVTGR